MVGEGPGASLVGFMMAMDNMGLVQCGVMVNPVTDWKTIGKKITIISNTVCVLYILQRSSSVQTYFCSHNPVSYKVKIGPSGVRAPTLTKWPLN